MLCFSAITLGKLKKRRIPLGVLFFPRLPSYCKGKVVNHVEYTNEYSGSTYDECNEEEKLMLNRVDKVCRQKHLKWKYCPGTNKLFIYTKISTWMTNLITDTYTLRHQNRIQFPKANFEYNFHEQIYEFPSIEETVKYITRHDQKKVKREQQRIYNSPLERAFREIKRHQV